MSIEPKIEQLKSKLGFGIKIWLEFEDNKNKKNVLGSGWANLLAIIDKNEDGSLTSASRECGYSYKYAWNILKRIEKRTGMPAVITGKGGRGGGGWIKLNEWGKYLLTTFNNLLSELDKIKNKIEEGLKIT